jgi:hypothetical protein
MIVGVTTKTSAKVIAVIKTAAIAFARVAPRDVL